MRLTPYLCNILSSAPFSFLFLSALGLSKSQMGFVLSLIPFFGLISLFVAPAAERFGYKRTWLLFWGMRDTVAIGLLLTPWVISRFGPGAALTYVAGVIAVFSMLRSIGITAMFPWVQEYVPNSVRGKYTAMNNMITTIAGFIAVAIGGIVLARVNTEPGQLTGFVMLIGVGIVFGYGSIALGFKIPGGAPQKVDKNDPGAKRDLWTAVRDRNMLLFLLSAGLITLSITPLNSFIPLFMNEQVGLSESRVVWLQTGALMGTLLSSYLWGWAADRYGSLPVAQYGLMLRSLLPFMWMMLPANPTASLYISLGIAFLQGVADMGWGIGSARLLYVNIVPTQKRRDYMAVYYAWIGVTAGISQLVSGRVLELTTGLSGNIGIFRIDPYLPLFVLGIIGPILSFLLLRRITTEQTIGMGRFTGIFLRGNPFLAMSSLVRYYMSRDEESTIRVTEQLGQSKSPLTEEELLAALDDPRFNVRMEAVISIARMAPDPRMITRLEEILKGSELALSAVAAWALGRMHDPLAVESLRDTLDSDYRSIRAASARALGSLDDIEMAPELLERLAAETDKNLKMSYASALGRFQYTAATSQILSLFNVIHNEAARMEIALDLARMIGDEADFIQLYRGVGSDASTTLSRAVSDLQHDLDKNRDRKTIRSVSQCSESFARGNLRAGAKLLSRLIDIMGADINCVSCGQILNACKANFASNGEPGMEYLVLAVYALKTCCE